MKKLLLLTLLMLTASVYSQEISDMLERSLGSVVTVAITESEDMDEVLLGVKGGESNVAYEKALDLSNFNACGSGFVIERNGEKYIVTNAHVVAAAKPGEGNLVAFSINRNRYEMQITGGDSFYDLALLEFITPPGDELTVMDFRKDEIRIGEQVYAIGNPEGDFPYSVSDGIISAKNRVRDAAPVGRLGFLQSTATVFQGNSGGPLIDSKGRVVGINSQLYATDFEGNVVILPQINFALEASVAEKIIYDILAHDGMVQRPFLGLEFSQTFEENGYGGGMWIAADSLPVITGVIPGSPAFGHAEVLKGAIVFAINGSMINGINQIQEEFEKLHPDQDVTLTILSNGLKQDIVIHSQLLDQPKLNSICRYFFEIENGSTLSIGLDNEVIFKTGSGTSKIQNEGYSTKKSSGLFSASNQEKVIIAAGLDDGEGSSMMWRINNLSDLGAALRLCGPYGVISLRLIDRNSPGKQSETYNLSFTNDYKLKRTLWY